MACMDGMHGRHAWMDTEDEGLTWIGSVDLSCLIQEIGLVVLQTAKAKRDGVFEC